MLVSHVGRGGKGGARELLRRVRLFDEGEWLLLIAESKQNTRKQGARRDLTNEQKAAKAQKLVQQGLVSKASNSMTSNTLAPGNLYAWAELTNPKVHPPSPSEMVKEHVLHHEPANPLQLDADVFAATLASCSRGLSPGLSGARYEHYKIALENKSIMSYLHETCEIIAQARVPESIRPVLGLSSLTATKKDNNRIRGISAGYCLRRLVARTISKQK